MEINKPKGNRTTIKNRQYEDAGNIEHKIQNKDKQTIKK
jgi:hypothetical protein